MDHGGAWSVDWQPGAPQERLAAALEALGRDAGPADAELVKQSPARRVWRLPATADEPGLYLKCYPVRGRLSLRAPARREFANLRRLARLGIPAVAPLACARLPKRWEVLATLELSGARTLAQALGDPSARAGLLDALAGLVQRLHAAGLWHRDLHAGNVLVAAGSQELVLVDVQKLRALPVALPRRLRLWDLGLLYDDLEGRVGAERRRIPAAYAKPPGWAAAIEAAAARRGRRRLASRARRCVRNSSGFRVERDGGRRIYRRADVPREAIDAALAVHREKTVAGARPASGEAASCSRVEGIRAGPPPGPAARPFDRGQGRPEPGSPALASIAVRQWREANPLRGHLGSALPTRGMKAWRSAHARMLRGENVRAPLALVEEGRLSILLERWEPTACRHRLE